MDRFDDMRARVSGSSGGGSEGGGGGPFGVDVMVQATDNFSVGDTFVGNAVSGATPTMYSVTTGMSGIKVASEDGTVAVKSESLGATATVATIYIKNEDAYTEVLVDLPDMTGATASDTCTINEDGTKIVRYHETFLILIEVDKTNKTATASRIDASSVSLSKFPFTSGGVTYDVTPNIFESTIIIKKNYLFVGMECTGVNGTNTKTIKTGLYGKISSSGISNEYVYKQVASGSGATPQTHPRISSGIIDYNDNNLIFMCSTYNIFRFEISLGKVVSCSEINTPRLKYITANGKYGLLSTGKTLYKINQETGSATAITTFTGSTTLYFVDETGEYVASTGYYWKASDIPLGTKLGNLIAPVGYGNSSGYFKIVDDSYIGADGKRYTLLPSSEAEYTIAHTTSVSTAGDIYGVVTEAMTMGETKTALKIFNK